MMHARGIYHLALVAVAAVLLSSCGIRRHKYADPITKNSEQPDKVLFDRAINDIEHSRYEIARLTLQTLINTYDSSEYLAKAKLAIADSWFREGGAHGLAQAEAEYKDFELFYPQMEEAAEAQERVCDIHYKQMDKVDRDPIHAIRAEDECRQLLLRWPNSKFAPETQQKLRNVQEALAGHEYAAAMFYHHKGSFPAAANRLTGMVDQYPLFSQSDEALWMLADSYYHMGDRFEDKQADAYTRIVKDYPLSEHAQAAKDKLASMKRPVPQPDPVAYARMKYELENRTKTSFVSRSLDMFRQRPDTHAAAKSGTPTMTAMHPGIPASVPQIPGAAAPAGGTVGASTSSDVSAAVSTDSKELDTRPDARANPPAGGIAAAAQPVTDPNRPGEPAVVQQPFATNHPLTEKDRKRAMKKAQEAAKKKQKEAAKRPGNPQPATTAQPATAQQPGAAQPPAAPTTPQTPPQDK
ncbi:MAG: outer membrane protein assembly factor BamD [Bryobacteraceae bacterium]